MKPIEELILQRIEQFIEEYGRKYPTISNLNNFSMDSNPLLFLQVAIIWKDVGALSDPTLTMGLDPNAIIRKFATNIRSLGNKEDIKLCNAMLMEFARILISANLKIDEQYLGLYGRKSSSSKFDATVDAIVKEDVDKFLQSFLHTNQKEDPIFVNAKKIMSSPYYLNNSKDLSEVSAILNDIIVAYNFTDNPRKHLIDIKLSAKIDAIAEHNLDPKLSNIIVLLNTINTTLDKPNLADRFASVSSQYKEQQRTFNPIKASKKFLAVSTEDKYSLADKIQAKLIKTLKTQQKPKHNGPTSTTR